MRLFRVCMLLFVVTCFMLSGCAMGRISLKKTFWDQKTVRIGVALKKPIPEAVVYQAGGQGALDIAINELGNEGLNNYLKSIKPNEFLTLPDAFVKELEARGMNAKKIEYPISPDKHKSDLDLGAIAKKEDIDLLIILSVDRFGIQRIYYGFIPLENPKAYCKATGTMFDLKSDEPDKRKIETYLWNCTIVGENATVAIGGKWNQPPDYPNLTKSIQNNVGRIASILINDFFGEEK